MEHSWILGFGVMQAAQLVLISYKLYTKTAQIMAICRDRVLARTPTAPVLQGGPFLCIRCSNVKQRRHNEALSKSSNDIILLYAPYIMACC